VIVVEATTVLEGIGMAVVGIGTEGDGMTVMATAATGIGTTVAATAALEGTTTGM
jgi:hypothetical protein